MYTSCAGSAAAGVAASPAAGSACQGKRCPDRYSATRKATMVIAVCASCRRSACQNACRASSRAPHCC